MASSFISLDTGICLPTHSILMLRLFAFPNTMALYFVGLTIIPFCLNHDLALIHFDHHAALELEISGLFGSHYVLLYTKKRAQNDFWLF